MSCFLYTLNRDYPIECRFNMKHVRDMIIKYSQIPRTDKYSQHRSIKYNVP